MSIQDHQQKLEQFIEDTGLGRSGLRFYNVLYALVDFDVVKSPDNEFNTYDVLVRRTHSAPFDMHKLSLVSHKTIWGCVALGHTMENAARTAKRMFVSKAVTNLYWGLYCAQYKHNNFYEHTSKIDPYRIDGEINPFDLDTTPQQEISYVIPAYNGKTLYLSGLYCSHGTNLDYSGQPRHNIGCYVGNSFKSLDAAIGDRQLKEANYVANILTAA